MKIMILSEDSVKVDGKTYKLAEDPHHGCYKCPFKYDGYNKHPTVCKLNKTLNNKDGILEMCEVAHLKVQGFVFMECIATDQAIVDNRSEADKLLADKILG